MTPPGKQWTAQLDKAETAAAPGSARDGHGWTPASPEPSASTQDRPQARPQRRPHRRPRLRDAIAELYDAWWDKRAPGRTRLERTARRPHTRDRGELVRRRRPGRRPARHTRLPASAGLETRHRHRHRPRHPSARPPPQEPPMTDDARMTWGFIIDVLNIFEPHSYRRSDDQHTGQAIGLIGDVVAHIHEGTLEAPRGAYVVVPSSRPPTSSLRPPPARVRSSSRPTRSRRFWPPWTKPPDTSVTWPRLAQPPRSHPGRTVLSPPEATDRRQPSGRPDSDRHWTAWAPSLRRTTRRHNAAERQ